jgi:PAS domain S-box-containing protein
MTQDELERDNAELRRRLGEAEDALAAIRSGEVDAIVVDGAHGARVFSLAGAEMVYRLAVQTMTEAVVNVALDGAILFCNPRFGELVATPAEQLLGRNIADYIAPEHGDGFQALLQRCSQHHVRQRVVFCGAAGVRTPTHLTGVPLRHGDRSSLCLLAADLTELETSSELIRQTRQQQRQLEAAAVIQRRAREAALNLARDANDARQRAEHIAAALREAHARLRRFIDADIVGVVIADAAGTILEANDYYLRVIGYTREELNQRNVDWLAVTPPEWRAADAKALAELRATDRCTPFEKEYVRRDGTRVAVLIADAMLPGPGETIASFVLDITDRKRAETALRESEARIQQALAASCSFTFEWVPATDTVRRSVSCEGILLLSGNEAEHDTGQRFFQRVHAADRERFVALLATLTPTRPGYTTEYRVVRGDGSVVMLEETGQAAFDAAGRLARLVGVSTDITARKQAEEELAQTRSQLAEGQRLAHLGSWEYCVATQNLIWSDEEKRIYGLATAQAPPDYETLLRRHVHPDDVAELEQRFRAALANQGPFDIEFRIVRLDGAVRWTYNKAQPHLDEQGNVLHYVGTTLDITERKQAEEALRASERREHARATELATLLDAAPVPVFIAHDPDCRHITGNRAAEEFLRTRPGGEVSLSAPAAVRPRHYRAVKDGRELGNDELPAQRAARGESVRNLDLQLVFDDGTSRDVIANGEPLLDEGGRPRGAVLVLTDITDLKQAEQQIRTSLREKEVLLKEVHHRVKNNMQVISSLVSLQEESLAIHPSSPGEQAGVRNPVTDDQVLGALAEMRDRIRTMALVHEKLYQSESLARINFADYADGLTAYLAQAQGGEDSDICLRLDVEPVSLPIDNAVPCGLILNELVTNAYKHAFRDHRPGTIVVRLQADPAGRVRLAVSDDGAGMPAGFDWRQASSLGLRLVQMLTRQIHGQVEARRPAGGGTEFVVEFGGKETP